MVLDVKTTLEIDPLTAGLQALAEKRTCTEEDFQHLRQALHRSSPIDQEQVRRLFDVHRIMPTRHSLWIEFFIEAVADFFLTRQGDKIFLSGEAEDLFIDAIGRSDQIADVGHRRLALRLLLRTTEPSERLQILVFNTVHQHLMKDDRRLLVDLPRKPRMVDIVDLHLIRKLVLGAGGQYPARINRVTVDFLLALDHPSLTFADPEAWQAFLLKAVSRHLIADQNKHDQSDSCHGIDEDAADSLIQHIHRNHKGNHKTSLIAHLTCEVEL